MAIEVGTASWTDKSLVASKKFYPRGCSSAEQRLRFYASQFSLVEVDSSYYAMPSAANSQLWVERTPPDFTFNIKAFRLFTGHQTGREALPRDIATALPPRDSTPYYLRDIPPEILDELWRRYIEALLPLQRAGKLGAVLFQFAPWLVNTVEARQHIEACAERMRGFTVAVEFRNKSWLDSQHAASTLAFERELGLVHVVMDAPDGVINRAHTVWEVTQPELAIVRLHGRNAETWSSAPGSTAAARFNYDYSDQELEELLALTRTLAARAARTHVVFNNCFEDQGQRNGLTFKRLLLGDDDGFQLIG